MWLDQDCDVCGAVEGRWCNEECTCSSCQEYAYDREGFFPCTGVSYCDVMSVVHAWIRDNDAQICLKDGQWAADHPHVCEGCGFTNHNYRDSVLAQWEQGVHYFLQIGGVRRFLEAHLIVK